MKQHLSRHTNRKQRSPGTRCGLSLLEVIAAVCLATMLAIVTMPKLAQPADDTKAAICELQRGRIEVEARSFHREYGRWPHSMNELMEDARRFPEGMLRCPLNDQLYSFNTADYTVNGHRH